MKIFNFNITDRCLYHKKTKTLIFGDLHIGYEDKLAKSGINIPRNQFNITIKILEDIFKKQKIENIILMGDIKHNFGRLTKQEIDDFKKLIDFFIKNNIKTIHIIKGNHDTYIASIAKKYSLIKISDFLIQNNTLFIHNYLKDKKITNKKIKLIIVAHFHPAFILKDSNNIRSEKYKCFLYGFSSKFKRNIIFIPSFFPLIEGSDIFNEAKIYEKGMKIVLIDNNGNIYDFTPTPGIEPGSP